MGFIRHPLNKAMMGWFAKHVFAKDADKKNPQIALIDADLKGLPPVTPINAEIDPLRSDGDLLETSLEKANEKVEHKLYRGVTHEFFGMAAVVDEAKSAQSFAVKRLKEAFQAKWPPPPGS